jgi:SAM-dependent methyltransferase
MLGRPARPLNRLVDRFGQSLRGPFTIQDNNTTRRAEYPWAYFATPLEPGLQVLELGGSLAGFQFVLDRAGCRVTNVDPGNESHGRGWPVDQESIRTLNRAFGTAVQLQNCFLSEAPLQRASFDRAYSISVLEHIPVAEIPGTIALIYDLLKPGGYFVLTLDLFLNLAPFCSRETNEYGSNISARLIAEAAPFELHEGERRELLGYDEFDPDRILSTLEHFMIGDYPALAQLMVLKKPGTSPPSPTPGPSVETRRD